MYVEMLDGHDIVWSTHVSRFAELLLARVPGFLKGNKLSMLLDSAVQTNTQKVQYFFLITGKHSRTCKTSYALEM